MRYSHPGGGRIELITGSMFSGKSEELIRRLRRAMIARQRVQVFKPDIDKRYSTEQVVSHSQWRLDSERVKEVKEILERTHPRTEVVGVDEAQFFSEALGVVCNHLADLGKRVIVAGLDMDFRGEPFGPIPRLMATSEYVDKMQAICARCGVPASYTQRLTAAQEQVLVGASEVYEARCRRCFEPGGTRQQPELFPAGDPNSLPPNARPRHRP